MKPDKYVMCVGSACVETSNLFEGLEQAKRSSKSEWSYRGRSYPVSVGKRVDEKYKQVLVAKRVTCESLVINAG